MNGSRPRCGALTLILAVALGQVAVSRADLPVPSPTYSTLPACITACPGGDRTIQVVVRDYNNFTLANSAVTLDFCACASVTFCPPLPSDGYVYGTACQVVAITNALGQATFRLRAGGSCSTMIPIYADGVLIGARRLVSTDQDGDLTITGADVAAVNAKIVSGDLTGDLDCSGGVSAADVAIVTAHGGHMCLVPTQTRGTRWGTLKLRYR